MNGQHIRLEGVAPSMISDPNINSYHCEPPTWIETASGLQYAELPPSIQARSSNSGILNWTKTEIGIACSLNFTSSGADGSLSALAGLATFEYSMESSTDMLQYTEITDASELPSFSYSFSFITRPGGSVSTDLSLVGRLISLNNSHIDQVESGTQDMQWLISENDHSLVDGLISWSERVAFRVQLADENQRSFVRLKPLFVMIAAHEMADQATSLTSNFTFDYLDTNLVGTSFCSMLTASAAARLSIANESVSWASQNLANAIGGMQTISGDSVLAFSGIEAQDGLVVEDASGGFAVPIRNSMRLPSGEGGGFSLRLCAVTELVHIPTSRRRLVWLETSPRVSMDEMGPVGNGQGKQEIRAHFGRQPVWTQASAIEHDADALSTVAILSISIGVLGIMAVSAIVYVFCAKNRPESYRKTI